MELLLYLLGSVLLAEAAIVNGIVASDQFPSVVRLKDPGCTATAVSDSTLITAGHCIIADLPVSYDGKLAVSVEKSSKIDLAVAVFSSETFSEWSEILDRQPRPGDTLELVGFGQTDYVNNRGGVGVKRYGVNRLLGFADLSGPEPRRRIAHLESPGTHLHYRSPISLEGLLPGELAMTGRGDSGGPIFIDTKLAGVVSMGGARKDLTWDFLFENESDPDDMRIYEYDVNISSEVAQEFLRQAAKSISASVSGLRE